MMRRVTWMKKFIIIQIDLTMRQILISVVVIVDIQNHGRQRARVRNVVVDRG